MSTKSSIDVAKLAKRGRPKEYPENIYIAGEDYECPDDDPYRDSPSAAREALDEDYVQDMLFLAPHVGFIQSVLCVVHTPAGFDAPILVCVEGRRTLRHSREVNRRLVEQGSQPLKVDFTLASSAVQGVVAFEVARISNKPGMEETDAQRVDYVRRLLALDRDKETICRILGIDGAAYEAYKAVGEATCIPAVREALDMGKLSISAAAQVAKQSVKVQREVILRVLGRDKRTPVLTARRDISDAGGTQFTVAPSKSLVRKVMEAVESPESPHKFGGGDVVRVLAWVLGELDVKNFPELDKLIADLP